jgi:hypothetical protein
MNETETITTQALPEGTKVYIINPETGEPTPSYGRSIQLLYVLRYDPVQDAYWCIAPFGVLGAGLRPTGNLGWSQFFLGTDTIAVTDHNPDHPRPTTDDLDRAHQELLRRSGEHLIPGNAYASEDRKVTITYLSHKDYRTVVRVES